MEKYVFEAIISSEPFVCNDCLVKEEREPIDGHYQDTGLCETCLRTNEVSKPNAASLLISKGFDLFGNYQIRELFFRTRPYDVIKEKL